MIDLISKQADELAKKYNETTDEEYKIKWYKKVEEIKYFVKEENDWK